MQRLQFVPAKLEADDPARRTAPRLLPQGCLTDEPGLVEGDQTSEAHFERRVPLGFDQCLPAAVEVDIDQQQPGLDARHIKR